MRKVIAISKRLWSLSKRTDQIGIPSLVHDDNIYSDSLTKSNILNNYFTSVLTKEDTTSIPSLSSQPCLDIDSLVIST